MGNIIAATSSIGIPLFNHLVTIPYIFHPQRWGGIPWKEPNFILLSLITMIFNVVCLMLIGTISGLMTTKQKCRKTNLLKSIKRSLWVAVGYIIGNMVMMLLPFIKSPLLVLSLWMPYAGWIIHGICVSLFVLLFGSIGNSKLRNEVC